MKSSIIILVIFSMLCTSIGYSQAFVDINAGIVGVFYSSAAWGDYDNDRDLDLLICGETSGGVLTSRIYQNNNGEFSDINAGIAGVTRGSAVWGDYDNDGDLDIALTGDNPENRTFIYRNDEDYFTDLEVPFENFGAYSHATWVDYDNDGDLDVFFTGSWISKLYTNEGNDEFSDSQAEFTMISSSRAAWGDLDMDGDPDLLLTGDTGGGMKLYYYENENGNFTESELANMGLSSGSIELGDYDSDGDLDIMIMGYDDYVNPMAKIYRNDGNLFFTDISSNLSTVSMGRLSWGDYDNDGDLDVALTGKMAGCGVLTTDIFENLGNDNFSTTNYTLTDAESSYLCWGDYDNDSDLDLLVCGDIYNGNPFAKIYRNDISLPNFQPEPPQNLEVTFTGNCALLSWSPGSDLQTPEEGLMYNLRIGTEPSNMDLCSPMSFMDDGFRKLPVNGNTTLSTQWKLYGLEEGQTYYWSVQTIDNTFAGSSFSEEHNFTYTLTGIDDNAIINAENFYPNPASDEIYFKPDKSLDDIVKIYSLAGQLVMETVVTNNKVNISALEGGIYFIHYKVDKVLQVSKLFIR